VTPSPQNTGGTTGAAATDDLVRARRSVPAPQQRRPSIPAQTPAPALSRGLTSCVPRHCTPPVGEAWTLPEGPGCAGFARSLLGEVLSLADAPRSAIADAKLMVSELATNAYQHAHGYGPHELWLYPADQSGEPADPCEMRCAVFDRFFGVGLPGYSWTSGDYGRGLSIVQELSGGRWGLLRTLSRCFPRGRGKAVWFAIPAPLRLPAQRG
jgi:hypothetical protein